MTGNWVLGRSDVLVLADSVPFVDSRRSCFERGMIRCMIHGHVRRFEAVAGYGTARELIGLGRTLIPVVDECFVVEASKEIPCYLNLRW